MSFTLNELLDDSSIRSVSGRAIPVPGNDIDTDRIIPARFMKCVTFDQLGQYAFYDARFNENGSKKEHSFNEEKYRGAAVMVVNSNFGCGSSREHAPQALKRWGIKAIIGESFAEIFADNCASLGMPAVTARKEDVEKITAFVKNNPSREVIIDLEKMEASCGDFKVSIFQPEQTRNALIRGAWDSTAELLSAANDIKETAKRLPYQNGFK